MLVNIFDGHWNDGYLCDGGRNLLLNTSTEYSDKQYCVALYKPIHPLVSGEYYTVTLSYTPAEGATDYRLYFSEGYVSVVIFPGDGTSKKVTSTTFKMRYAAGRTPNDDERFGIARIYRFPNDGTVTGYSAIHWIKIETGTVATDWTPAPEDESEQATAHPNSVFSNIIPVKKNTQYMYGLADSNELPAHTIRYMKTDGTWVKAVHVDEDTTSGFKSITFDDDYNIEIMFQNGLSSEQKANFKLKEENNMAIKATNQITITDVTDAYSVMLTSEAYTFVGGTGGVAAGQSCTTEAVAFCGQNQCAAVSVDSKSITCPTGITATVENSGTSKVKITFKTTATVSTACEATIPVVVDGITVNKKFSFAVARTGNTGKGISGTPKAQYASSSSGTTAPTSGWQDTVPSVAQGSFLWTKVTTNYTDGTSTVSYSASKQGTDGNRGSQWYSGTGITGTSTTATAFSGSGVSSARVNDMYLNTSSGLTYKCTVAGDASTAKWVYAGSIKGNTGNGISSATVTYATSSSGTTPPTSGWQSTQPSVAAGNYLWTKTVFAYTNGAASSTQYSVARQGVNGKDSVTLTIESSNGTIFKNNTGNTVLTARVFVGAVEQTITDAGVCGSLGSIKWYKVGTETAVATAKTFTVSAADVDSTQAYTCQLEG